MGHDYCYNEYLSKTIKWGFGSNSSNLGPKEVGGVPERTANGEALPFNGVLRVIRAIWVSWVAEIVQFHCAIPSHSMG